MDYDVDQELLELIRKRKEMKEQAAALEQAPDNPLGRALVGLASGYAGGLTGGNGAAIAQNVLDQHAKQEASQRDARIKALDSYDTTIKSLAELSKARRDAATQASKEEREEKRLAQSQKKEERQAADAERRHRESMAALTRKEAKGADAATAQLRNEWLHLPATKNTQMMSEAVGKMREAASNPSPAADISLIYGYMRANDPGSTVREGEYATAQNAGGVPERIRNAYNKAISGERLTPEQRTDFLTQAERMYGAQLKTQQKWNDQYAKLAGKVGVDPGFVTMDFDPAVIPTPKTARSAGGGLVQSAIASGAPPVFDQRDVAMFEEAKRRLAINPNDPSARKALEIVASKGLR